MGMLIASITRRIMTVVTIIPQPPETSQDSYKILISSSLTNHVLRARSCLEVKRHRNVGVVEQ
jgi:hypothetical protein